MATLEVLNKLQQLNKDLAPIAGQIGELLEKFSAETEGHGADVVIFPDWRSVFFEGSRLGICRLVQIQIEAKLIPLPEAPLHRQ